MSNINIDKSLNIHLGLPEDYELDKNDAFELYQYFMSLLETKKPIGVWLMYYYIGFHGGKFYKSPKDKRDIIVKDIVDNMNTDDKFLVMLFASEFPEPIDNGND